MAKLRTEYTDIKNVIHNVEHTTVAKSDSKAREQILDELFTVFSRKNKHTSTDKKA